MRRCNHFRLQIADCRLQIKIPPISHLPSPISRLAIISLCLVIVLVPFNSFSQESDKTTILSLSINDVRLIAIKNNLDIKLAHLDSKIKGTELSYKEAVFDTILNAEIGYTNDQRKPPSSLFGSKNITNDYNIGIDKKLRTGTDVEIDFTNAREWTNSAFVSANPYHESEVAISITQPVAKNFFGLIDRGNIEIVKYEIKNIELSSYIDIENALLSTEKAYWELVLAQEKVKIKKEMFKKAIRLFNQYRRKLKIGLVETGDVLATEANMHIRRNELLLTSNELKTSEETLKTKLNLEQKFRIIPKDKLLESNFKTDFTKSLQIAFNNRRDYKSNKNSIEEKKVSLKMKANSRFPEIDLKATFATNGIDGKYYRALSDILEDSNPKYYVGIKFEFPLENNLANSEHEKASLEKTKAIITLQKTEREIISDIDKNFRKVSVNKTNILNLERVENLQKGKLFQEEKRFFYGRSNIDTIIRYQEDLLKARLATKNAYFDYKISILDLMDAEDSFLGYIGLE